ncbi:hypothetical protein [Streptomyces marianii]|uniref:Uncharacterized protein n=1 Tax=Streptomyces marianii TaxID=1817406 RepID=A0A5R9DR84_9ACTN|nr:hypothetical protein [Streptomyces marianii]TLQ39009.1 hypothetical protein FEF34_40070 [Streptomyces marianii]
MSDIATATWTTHIRGERVEIPATIEGIRAVLDEADVEAFDAEVESTPAQDLHRVLARWALPAEATQEDDELLARLKAGDFSGCIPQDEPRSVA